MSTTTISTAPVTQVPIIGGKYKGKVLRFVKRTPQKIGVERESDGKTIYLDPSHVDMTVITHATTDSGSNSSPPRPVTPPVHDQDPAEPQQQPVWVRITGGKKYKGKTLRFLRYTEKCVAVQREDGTEIYLKPEHVDVLSSQSADALAESSGVTHTTTTSGSNSSPPRPVTPPVYDRDPPEPQQQPVWVRITGGKKYKGKTLRFVRYTEKCVAVQREDGTEIYLKPEHVDVLSSQSAAALAESSDVRPVTPDPMHQDRRTIASTADESFVTAMEEDTIDFVMTNEHESKNSDDDDFVSVQQFGQQTASASSALVPGDQVRIHRGTHANKVATFVKYTAQRVGVRLQGETQIKFLLPSALEEEEDVLEGVNDVNDVNDTLVSAIREHLPQSIKVRNTTASKVQQTLLGTIFGEMAVFFDMNATNLEKLPQSFVVTSSENEHNDESYILAAVKCHGNKFKSLTCAYLHVSCQDDVATSLLRIGSFDKLKSRKTASRLELLLSTAASSMHIHPLQASDFRTIEENGNVGCGFIPRSMIDQLLRRCGHEESEISQVCALQVRVAIPSMGIFKGMLVEKPGIDQIELPPSMQKVDASTTWQTSVAWLMINQTGIYPSQFRLEQEANAFQMERDFPVMARWMLTQKGVSQSYLQQPNRHHTNLVGVADPTNSIPTGSVYISGIHNHPDEFGAEVIVSRFPMTEASDGRILPIVRTKPPSMTAEHWNFLCSKPFGLIFFGNPPPGGQAMPEMIAQGDLDGDGYFCCWDSQIIRDAIIGDHPVFPKKDTGGAFLVMDWLSATQEFMADIQARKQSHQLVGRLHDGWLRKIKAMCQSDAVSFGRAYKDALVAQKHGGLVDLPRHLAKEIPWDLRRFLNQT